MAEVIDRVGYDPVQLGRLRDGRLLEPGGPVFGISLLRDEFESAIATETEFAGLVEDALSGVGPRPLTDPPKDMP